MAFIVIKRPFLAVFPKRKRLQWQIFAPAASPSVSRHGASLQVSPESARNQLLKGGPENPFFLLYHKALCPIIIGIGHKACIRSASARSSVCRVRRNVVEGYGTVPVRV